jgi:hypothetical protein
MPVSTSIHAPWQMTAIGLRAVFNASVKSTALLLARR